MGSVYEDKFEHGIIDREGPRENKTDCESDVILIHVPTKTVRRFHGSWWYDSFRKEINDWILSFPKSKKVIKAGDLQYCYTCDLNDISPGVTLKLKEQQKG